MRKLSYGTPKQQYCVNEASEAAINQAYCAANHANCYCTRADFLNSVTACAQTHCTNYDDISLTKVYATGYCDGTPLFFLP
jgi:hypothetical protein